MTRLHLDIQALRSRIGNLRDQFPDVFDDEEWLADVLEGESSFHEVMARLLDERQQAAAMVQAVKERRENLSERQQRYGNKSSKISEIMLGLMQESGLKKLELPEATISVRDGVPSVVITDETALPDSFIRTKTEPDKAAIKDALKAGQDVPGATLSNAGPSVTVRTR